MLTHQGWINGVRYKFVFGAQSPIAVKRASPGDSDVLRESATSEKQRRIAFH
jgi:hypothetical protein